MKAFVTGGTGFIGSRLVRRLRERGDDVVALVRSPEKADGACETWASSWSRATCPPSRRSATG